MKGFKKLGFKLTGNGGAVVFEWERQEHSNEKIIKRSPFKKRRKWKNKSWFCTFSGLNFQCTLWQALTLCSSSYVFTMICSGVGDLYLNLELRNVNSTLTTEDAKARLEDLTNKVLVKWITAIALQRACGVCGSCWADYKTQAADDKSFGWVITYVKNLSNNVSWLRFLYQSMVRPPFFAQSNPLYYVNLLASFAWFWPSSS